MTKHLILQSQLRAFSFYPLDTACMAIQRIIGVQSGDLAGVIFSGFDWEAASVQDRAAMLRIYLNAEIAHKD